MFLIHDFAGRADDFAVLAPRLAGLGYRVVTMDLPGRGRSARLPQESYTAELYVQVLLAVMKPHWLPRAFVLGQAWGAMIAVLFESVARLRFSGMVLLDLPQKWSYQTDLVTQLWERIARVEAGDESAAMGEIESIVPTGIIGRKDLLLLAAERLRSIEGRTKLSVDHALFSNLRESSEKVFDLQEVLERGETNTWLVQGARSLKPFRLFSLSDRAQQKLSVLRILRASNLSWRREDICLPVLGLFAELVSDP